MTSLSPNDQATVQEHRAYFVLYARRRERNAWLFLTLALVNTLLSYNSPLWLFIWQVALASVNGFLAGMMWWQSHSAWNDVKTCDRLLDGSYG